MTALVVTGVTGFVGRHVVQALLERGHKVTAGSRNSDRGKAIVWNDKVHFIGCDVHNGEEALPRKPGNHDALIHLAWDGLENYRDSLHLAKHHSGDIEFLGNMIKNGAKHLLVTGTCSAMEYYR